MPPSKKLSKQIDKMLGVEKNLKKMVKSHPFRTKRRKELDSYLRQARGFRKKLLRRWKNGLDGPQVD